jgi:integrase
LDPKIPSTAPGSLSPYPESIKILVMINARKDGSYIPKSTLFNAFSRILKKSELAPLPIHSLRHTHAVLLLEAGNGSEINPITFETQQYPSHRRCLFTHK